MSWRMRFSGCPRVVTIELCWGSCPICGHGGGTVAAPRLPAPITQTTATQRYTSVRFISDPPSDGDPTPAARRGHLGNGGNARPLAETKREPCLTARDRAVVLLERVREFL